LLIHSLRTRKVSTSGSVFDICKQTSKPEDADKQKKKNKQKKKQAHIQQQEEDTTALLRPKPNSRQQQ
jgi:ribosome-binding protein aMBF1 (putative translation factor)